MARKVCLVTGASGFIGPHLVGALATRGHRVRCLVRQTSQTAALDELGVEFATGDVSDRASLEAAVAGVDEVYHLAGVTKAFRPADFTRVNEQGTRNLAEACAARPSPPVLVVVSSLAAAGVAPSQRDRTESDPAAPVSVYGRSKRAGELAAEALAARVPTTIVRPPIVFGEGDRDMLQMFAPIERLGIHVVPGFRPRRFSLVHASDLAEALVLAAERGSRIAAGDRETSCGYYFAAHDEQPTYAELGRMLGQALGRRWTIAAPLPEVFGWALAGVNELLARLRQRPGILNFDKMREATAGSWTCSPQRAQDELGFRPAATLADRLAQTARWYRAQGWL